jgi:plastocyanin domain-containing protein
MKYFVSTVVVIALSVACKREETVRPNNISVVTAPANGRIAVLVDGQGYHPSTVLARAGQQLTLVFTRNTDETCGQQLVFPTINVRRDLPLNQAVEVAVTVPATGSLGFTCGMNMYQGSVNAQ